MHIISLMNYKGGVGKTTVAANLGAGLASRGYRVLMLDLDPQASLTFSFITPQEWYQTYAGNHTIKAWFDALTLFTGIPLTDLVTTPQRVGEYLNEKGKLDLIPSDLELINVEEQLAHLLGGAHEQQEAVQYLKVHGALAKELKSLKNGDYDIVLIDCPPNFSIVTKNAVAASQSILVPAKPDYLSTVGIQYLRRNVKSLSEKYNSCAHTEPSGRTPRISPEIKGVVFTMIQVWGGLPIQDQRQYIRQTREEFGERIMDSRIRDNKRLFGASSADLVPAILYDGPDPTYHSIVEELKGFVSEFEALMGLHDEAAEI